MEHSEEDSPEEDKISGAGVVPITTAPNGTVYVLLGREKFVKNWSSSLKWSGFEGGNTGAESAVENASRELIEESLGMIFSDKESLIKMLETRNYIARIAVKTMNGTRTHVTYLKYIPWDPDLPVRFGNTMNYLVGLSKLGARLKTLNRHARGTRTVPDPNNEGWTFVQSNDKNSLDRVKVQAFEFLNNPPSTEARTHPAISIEYDEDNSISSIHVKEEYIEKTQIKYWPLNELEAACKNGGTGMQDAAIRPYFCIIAKLICKYVTKKGKKQKVMYVYQNGSMYI